MKPIATSMAPLLHSSHQSDLALSAFTKNGHSKKEDALGNDEVIIENSLATMILTVL